MDHLTAKVSCFARAYHRRTNVVPVFDDTAAEALLGEDFPQIAQSMKDGAVFFLPGFTGTPEEALRRIVGRSRPRCSPGAHTVRMRSRVKSAAAVGNM